MSITMYGIKNCDTVKKARAWLDAHRIEYQFHDYKIAGVTRASLERWVEHFGWEAVLNRAGTTFRKLPDADKENLSAKKAITLMLAHPSAIKRPLLDVNGEWHLGFKPENYEAVFTKNAKKK